MPGLLTLPLPLPESSLPFPAGADGEGALKYPPPSGLQAEGSNSTVATFHVLGSSVFHSTGWKSDGKSGDHSWLFFQVIESPLGAVKSSPLSGTQPSALKSSGASGLHAAQPRKYFTSVFTTARHSLESSHLADMIACDAMPYEMFTHTLHILDAATHLIALLIRSRHLLQTA